MAKSNSETELERDNKPCADAARWTMTTGTAGPGVSSGTGTGAWAGNWHPLRLQTCEHSPPQDPGHNDSDQQLNRDTSTKGPPSHSPPTEPELSNPFATTTVLKNHDDRRQQNNYLLNCVQLLLTNYLVSIRPRFLFSIFVWYNICYVKKDIFCFFFLSWVKCNNH